MTTGIIGQIDVTVGADALVGTLDENMVFNVNVCNRTSNDIKIKIALGTGASPVAANWIEYDTAVVANGILERSGLTGASGLKIWVRTDTAGATVTATAYGLPAA